MFPQAAEEFSLMAADVQNSRPLAYPGAGHSGTPFLQDSVEKPHDIHLKKQGAQAPCWLISRPFTNRNIWA
jgi:hypothetical protein